MFQCCESKQDWNTQNKTELLFLLTSCELKQGTLGTELVHERSEQNYQASKLGHFLCLWCLAQFCCLLKYCKVQMAFPYPFFGFPLSVTRLRSGMETEGKILLVKTAEKTPLLLLLLLFYFLAG